MELDLPTKNIFFTILLSLNRNKIAGTVFLIVLQLPALE
jgi:hypothetical protein